MAERLQREEHQALQDVEDRRQNALMQAFARRELQHQLERASALGNNEQEADVAAAGGGSRNRLGSRSAAAWGLPRRGRGGGGEEEGPSLEELMQLREHFRHHQWHTGHVHYGGLGAGHRGDALDVDNMSYEQLLALGERMGDVKSKGLTKAQIRRLPVSEYVKRAKAIPPLTAATATAASATAPAVAARMAAVSLDVGPVVRRESSVKRKSDDEASDGSADLESYAVTSLSRGKRSKGRNTKASSAAAAGKSKRTASRTVDLLDADDTAQPHSHMTLSDDEDDVVDLRHHVDTSSTSAASSTKHASFNPHLPAYPTRLFAAPSSAAISGSSSRGHSRFSSGDEDLQQFVEPDMLEGSNSSKRTGSAAASKSKAATELDADDADMQPLSQRLFGGAASSKKSSFASPAQRRAGSAAAAAAHKESPGAAAAIAAVAAASAAEGASAAAAAPAPRASPAMAAEEEEESCCICLTEFGPHSLAPPLPLHMHARRVHFAHWLLFRGVLLCACRGRRCRQAVGLHPPLPRERTRSVTQTHGALVDDVKQRQTRSLIILVVWPVRSLCRRVAASKQALPHLPCASNVTTCFTVHHRDRLIFRVTALGRSEELNLMQMPTNSVGLAELEPRGSGWYDIRNTIHWCYAS